MSIERETTSGEDARDAARYRWLRDQAGNGLPVVMLDGRWHGTQHRACLDLDAAIDRAMSATPPAGEQ